MSIYLDTLKRLYHSDPDVKTFVDTSFTDGDLTPEEYSYITS